MVGGEDVTAQIASVEIDEGDRDCYLFYFDANGNCLTDTWHETLERAKAQALFEFAIDEDDWSAEDGLDPS